MQSFPRAFHRFCEQNASAVKVRLLFFLLFVTVTAISRRLYEQSVYAVPDARVGCGAQQKRHRLRGKHADVRLR